MESLEKLILYTNSGTHAEYLMPDESRGGNAIIFVGRGENNEIRPRSLHVSKRHCAIKRQAGRYYLTDFGSANGVSVRGKRIPAFVDVEIFDEDVVEGPDFSLRCRLPVPRPGDLDPVPGEASERTGSLFAKARALANAPWTRPAPGAPPGQPVAAEAHGMIIVRWEGRTVATQSIVPPCCTVGVHPSCDLKLPATPGVAARHLAVTCVEGRHRATAYAPGVFLNERMELAVETPVELHHADQIRVGPYVLGCVLPPAPAPAATGPDGSNRFDRTRLLETPDLGPIADSPLPAEPDVPGSTAESSAGWTWDSTPAARATAVELRECLGERSAPGGRPATRAQRASAERIRSGGREDSVVFSTSERAGARPGGPRRLGLAAALPLLAALGAGAAAFLVLRSSGAGESAARRGAEGADGAAAAAAAPAVPAGGMAATPAPAAPAEGAREPAAGWHGELMPAGLRRAALQPVYIWDTGKGLEIEMVYVPPGDFHMGADDGDLDERPRHRHSIAYGYYIGRHETTWAEFRGFCRSAGEPEPDAPGFGPPGEDHPVVNVSWRRAAAFCAWAGLRLPTEPEWEKAARGMDGRPYPWGKDDPAPDSCVWSRTPAFGGKSTAPVGTCPKGASLFGVHDMAGNVAEWCLDWYDGAAHERYARGVLDPPATGKQRVVRGGCYWDVAMHLRTSHRLRHEPEPGVDSVGFRPCRKAEE